MAQRRRRARSSGLPHVIPQCCFPSPLLAGSWLAGLHQQQCCALDHGRGARSRRASAQDSILIRYPCLCCSSGGKKFTPRSPLRLLDNAGGGSSSRKPRRSSEPGSSSPARGSGSSKYW